jgi:hypothetical protein
MYGQRRDFLLLMTLAAAAATPALGQTPVPAVGPAGNGMQSAASIPDFSGIWGHLSLPGFEPPLSGPGPVVNKSRTRQVVDGDGRLVPATNGALVSSIYQFVGDYSNPILRPEAAEVVKKHGEIELSGVPAPIPSNQCWPGGVPFVFWNIGMQMLQQPHQITILYSFDHEVRHVRVNQSHPGQVTPSWYGDSVGHYEGDTLVIDTVGIKADRPFAMIDMYGTPHTQALHVVERYRLLDYEAAKEAEERGEKENFRLAASDAGFTRNPDYKGKGLQLQFTVEDEGVFTMPWSATITYRRPLSALGGWPEFVCAENLYGYFPGKKAAIPTADRPDF